LARTPEVNAQRLEAVAAAAPLAQQATRVDALAVDAPTAELRHRMPG